MNSPIGGNHWKMFGSPGRIDTNQGRAHLRRGNYSNLSPHEIPLWGGSINIFFPRLGHEFFHGGEPLKNLGRRGGWKLIRVGRT